MNGNEADRALMAIPTPADRETWLMLTMAYKAAEGANFETWDAWSRQGQNYDEAGNRDTWNSITPQGGRTAATLIQEAKRYGWEPEAKSSSPRRKQQPQKAEATGKKPRKQTQLQRQSIREYIQQCAEHRAEALPYLQGRGISEEAAARFNLGFDPKEKRLVIPYPGEDYYISRSTAIPPNGAAAEGSREQRYKYPPGMGKQLFNAPALVSGAAAVFVTEGQIDAISLEQQGAAAIGCNEAPKLIEAIQEAGTELTARYFFIVPDNDETGRAKAEKVLGELTKAGIEAKIYPIPGEYHDVNEYQVKSAAELYEWVKEAEGISEREKSKALDEYQKESGAGRIQALKDYIQANANRKYISTGFHSLDIALGDGCRDRNFKLIPGGLIPGLYVVGAISSLGKTSWVMQIADSIAAQEQDVLIVALEMSANELMAKSISRITAETADNEEHKKTVQGILQGRRYLNYSENEKGVISRAFQEYAAIAKRLYFIEGAGDTGLPQVRAAVQRHKEITGNTPVLIVDYLQILEPLDTHATDKANIDGAIKGMKQISRDYDTPVICISSFNRMNYSTQVNMEAFKESGAIEYSGDVIIGLQLKGAGDKDFDVNAAKAAEPRQIEAMILKNRSGKTGQTVYFEYYPKFNLFLDTAEEANGKKESAGFADDFDEQPGRVDIWG